MGASRQTEHDGRVALFGTFVSQQVRHGHHGTGACDVEVGRVAGQYRNAMARLDLSDLVEHVQGASLLGHHVLLHRCLLLTR